MSDKVQKIREEIERRIKEISDACDGVIMVETISVEYNTLCNIRDYINSLPEENHFEDKSEMVSEDLEEAALKYRWEHPFCDGYTAYSFKAGAEWQKRKDQETIELAEDHAMLAGMNKMKEEMMENAIESIVEDWCGDFPEITIPLNPQDFKTDDKVKIIIVKEEQ